MAECWSITEVIHWFLIKKNYYVDERPLIYNLQKSELFQTFTFFALCDLTSCIFSSQFFLWYKLAVPFRGLFRNDAWGISQLKTKCLLWWQAQLSTEKYVMP